MVNLWFKRLSVALTNLFRIEPILYEVVSLRDSESVNSKILFHNLHQTSVKGSKKTPENFRKHVKCLCITYTVRLEDAAELLSVCSNVCSLACWVRPDAVPASQLGIPTLLSALRPKRFSGHLTSLLANPIPNFSLPFFSNMTHLEILEASRERKSWTWTVSLNSITHLTILEGWDAENWIESGLSQEMSKILRWKSLRVLVLRRGTRIDPNEEEDLNRQLGTLDMRMVIGSITTNFVENWEVHVMGGEDLWTFAERVIQQRLEAKMRTPNLNI